MLGSTLMNKIWQRPMQQRDIYFVHFRSLISEPTNEPHKFLMSLGADDPDSSIRGVTKDT